MTEELQVPWSQFGGVSFSYKLKREQAQQQLHKHPTKEVELTIQKVIDGRRIALMRAQCNDGLDLWLFPEHLPDYLRLVDLLEFVEGHTVRAQVRESASNPSILFLINILEFK